MIKPVWGAANVSRLAFDFRLQKDAFTLAAQAEVETQGVIGLIGPSGAGKTTLLRCLAGLEPGCTGMLQLGASERHRLAAHQRGISMVFQQPSLFPHLTVAGNLAYAWRRAPSSRRLQPQSAAAQLGVEHLLDRQASGLSGGEVQRVCIARALVSGPEMLILDEPLAGVDVQGRREVMACLEQLRIERPVPMLYVSHNLDEIARLADEILYMQAGSITAQGAVSTMLTRLDLPLAQGPDAEAVLDGRVMGHHEADLLTHVSTAAGDILLAQQTLPLNSPLRLRIAARDVSLALSRPADSSILNILPCTVAELSESEAGQCLVRLNASGCILLARITRRSARKLGLKPQMTVFAQIKSVALA